ncbi:hypothetical protein GBF38_007522 [Nibea albiflora]|uniref:Uncharacterized protein n=1 Tax=Nibea albiflora TaxID=240163 RepID=A0ACB7ENC4_NIBAL|nr:hypothetical protein GBF38_007522 [Nibea albiflora]
MLGCLHYWHTGQECGDERGLVERLSENTYTSRLALQARALSLRKNFSALKADSATQQERPAESTFLERPWKERESQNKDNRHNHQEKLVKKE